MIIKYKNYTLILYLSIKGMNVPTLIKELNKKFDDVAQAKKYIDTL